MIYAEVRECLSIRAIDLAGNLSEPTTRCTSVVDRPGDKERTYAPLLQFPHREDGPGRRLPWAPLGS